MAAAYPSAKGPIARLFDVVPGALSQSASLAADTRLHWPSDLHEWLHHFPRLDFSFLCAQKGCLLMMTPQDCCDCFLPLVDMLPNQGLRQMASGLRIFGARMRRSKEGGGEDRFRFRIDIPLEAVKEAFGVQEDRITNLQIIAKRRWVEIWQQPAFDQWQARLQQNPVPGWPLPPPPFTPDVVDTYIRACRQSAPRIRKAA
jgi:hypothetical protein